MSTGESETDKPNGSRRIIITLAAIAAVALLAVAGLIGFIVADSSGDQSAADSSSDAGSPADVPDDEIPDLRPVAERAMSDGAAAEQSGTIADFRDWSAKYAVPACGEVLIGIAEAFGPDSEPEPKLLGDPKVVSVDQDGSVGVVVTKSAPNRDAETIHWIYNGSEWRFTCEGLFDTGTTETSTESSATTATTAAPPVTSMDPVEESTPVAGGRCWDREVGQRIDGLECRWSGENARWVEIAPATTAEEDAPLPESTPVVQGPCYSWENLQVRQGLVCVNSTNFGFVWLPDSH